MTVCALAGCVRPAFVEPRTLVEHKYCGRTHATEALGRLPPPHGVCHECSLNGCRRTVAFETSTGRVHDFCCKEHANEAISSGQWAVPLKDSSGRLLKNSTSCSLPGCGLPVLMKASGVLYDYCGRTHAIEHRKRAAQSQAQSTLRRAPAPATASLKMAAAVASGVQSNASQAVSSSVPAIPPLPVPLTSALKKAVPYSSGTTSSNNPAGSAMSRSSSTSHVNVTPVTAVPKAPLCSFCLENNACVILIPCGHVCLCEEHATTLKASNSLKICPCCKQAVESTCKVFMNF